MQSDLPTIRFNQSALFLDFDGTLVDLQATPDGVTVNERLRQLLLGVNQRTNNALALISGRSVESLDHLVKLPQLAISGSHGMQYRHSGESAIDVHPQVAPLPQRLIENCQAFCNRQQLLLECKPYSVAIHYRHAPEKQPLVESFLQKLLLHTAQLEIQPGKLIRELKPAGIDKSSALDLFSQRAPFADRTPWYFGDDATDEHAFAWVNRHQGVSVKIGEGPTCAQYRLPSPSELISHIERHLLREEHYARQ